MKQIDILLEAYRNQVLHGHDDHYNLGFNRPLITSDSPAKHWPPSKSLLDDLKYGGKWSGNPIVGLKIMVALDRRGQPFEVKTFGNSNYMELFVKSFYR